MARFPTFCVVSLALILSGTPIALGQPSTIPPPQSAAPQALTGRMIVINPQPVAGDSPDFRLFGHSFRDLLNATPSQSDRLNVLRQMPAQTMAGNEKVADPRWPERVNPVAKTGMTWSIHSLSELGQDAEHGKWLAETITQVVQPQSWTVVNGQKATITYQPQGKALIVYNTPEVQEEVTAFLSKLKRTATGSTPSIMLPPPAILSNSAQIERTSELIRQLNDEQEMRKALQEQVAALKTLLKDRESDLKTALCEDFAGKSKQNRDDLRHWQTELDQLHERIRRIEEYRLSAVHLPSSEKTIIPASFNLGLPAHTVATAGTKGWVVPYDGARQPVGAPPEHAHGRAGSAHPANPYGGYPVPSVRQPKHLFHFIIRYEGEGISDANVVDMLKIKHGNGSLGYSGTAEYKNAAEKEESKKTAEIEYPPPPNTPEKQQAKVKWRTDYTAARQEAKEKKLPIVIMFWKHDCPMCVKMDETTFQDALIIGVLNDKFIPVKVGGDGELATALNVESYPCFVFAASDGRIMQRQSVGYKDATAFFDEVLKALDQRHLPDLPLQKAQPAQLLAPPPTVPSLQELPPPSPPSAP